MQEPKRLMNEGIFFSEENYDYKYDLWKNGKSNKLFIVGLSGSGKTTLGKKLAERYDCDYVELDQLIKECRREFIRKYGEEAKHDLTHEDKIAIVNEYVMDKIKKIKDKTVFEGCQILWLDFNYISKFPILILNTSLILSSLRAYNRNKKLSDYKGRIDSILDIYKHQSYILRDLKIFKSKLEKLKQDKEVNYSIKKINSYDEFLKYITPLENEIFNDTRRGPRPKRSLDERLVRCIYLYDEDKSQSFAYSLIQYYKAGDNIDRSKLAISRLGISKEYKGMGFGDILIKSSIEWVKKHTNFKVLYIGVEKKNKEAQSLYTKHGFKIDKEVSHSYLMKVNL